MPAREDKRSAEALSYRDWYKTKDWYRLRSKHLKKEPWCVVCAKQKAFDPSFVIDTAQRMIVDHKTPHRGNWNLFIDPNNLQTLCQHHHSSMKQASEKRRVVPIGVDGWPLEER